MAHWKTQAWVTSAVDDSTVQNALVLAESIRKTQTTRRISVITSMNVSMKNRFALRQGFDLVFLMDETFAPGGIAKGLRGETQAKIYAFSLILFEKCVFVSSNSLFLENVDSLFETENAFLAPVNPQNGSIDTSIFMLKPDQSTWSSIWESVNWNGEKMTDMQLSLWFQNQNTALKMKPIPEKIISDFNLALGELTRGNAHAGIVHLIGAKQDSASIAQQMGKLDNEKMSLPGHIVRDLWMELARKIDAASQDLMTMTWRQPITRKYNNEPIAIVGMSCRYPGANTLEEFWNMLFSGEEGIRECPTFRWKKEHTVRVSQQDKKSQAGFLSTTVDEFDARFFGVSPKEAAYMDPQSRLLHEVMWESLEDAGINPLSLYGSHTGIFTGSWMNDYKDIVQCSAEKDFFRTYMGNSIGAAAARLSFLLGLTGPSIATESGCSSAIVALDLAVKSLRCRETNLAVAGGVNLLLHPFNSSMMELVISPNGRCKTFDSGADGFGRAEGCGVLVLKRMTDALRDRDHIWALIRGSAVSQEGISRSLGTPTVHCEALAMQLALKDADVSPELVTFVETHGTGTQVGDPMEVSAIAKAYHAPNRKEPLVIGSVKTNVGHTESCSGITGIMKAVLALQHNIIPKHRNLETLNPEIFLDSIPAIIPMENLPWPRIPGQSRLCGVSSFGITGTDGHVILEDAPDYEYPKFHLGLERPTHLMTISGKTSEALEELLNEYQNRFLELAEKGGNDFANVAYSANLGRASFAHRSFLVANNYEDAAKMIKEKRFLLGEVKEGSSSQICFLFTGQGSQYQGMAKTLYETAPIFRIAFDRCDRYLRERYNLSICDTLWGTNSNELSRTIYSQTSIFCVEYCLLKLWESWGIKPDFVLGHSLGEFCAAVAAGVLDFEDALRLVAERSRMIDNLPRGSMLVIKASKPEVEKWMKAANIDLDFAAVNNPEQTVVAGDTKTVESFLAYLKGHGIKAIILEATHAFHSRHMDPMLESYRKVAQLVEYKPVKLGIQYISGMEGRVIDDISELGADYWVRHTREKVSFIEACTVLLESGVREFIEMGPQPVLSTFVMQNNEGTPLNCFPSLRRGTNDWDTILTSLGKLYLLGYQVDLRGYDEPYIRKKVSLPFHPFHRKSFWVDCSVDQSAMIHPLVGHPLKNASSVNIFQNDVTLKSLPYLKDHCIGNRVVFPGAGYMEMCLSAGYCVANGLTESLEPPTRALRLENLRVEAPMELKEDKVCRLQAIVDLPENSSEANSGFRVKIFHQNTLSPEESGKWVLHASSTFIPVANTKECMGYWNPNRISEVIGTNEPLSTDDFYKRVDEAGLKFGKSFRSLRRFWAVKEQESKTECDEIVAEMEVPSDWNKYLLHPVIIDAMIQTGILTGHRYSDSKLKVPVHLGGLTVFPGMEGCQAGSTLYFHARKVVENTILYVSTPDQNPVAFMEDMELLDTTVATIESVLELQSSTLPDRWEESWKVIPSPFSTQVELDLEKEKSSEFVERTQAIGSNSPQNIENYKNNRRLIFLCILNGVQQLGWKPEVGDNMDVGSFCTALGILPEFLKLVRFYFSVFQEDGGVIKTVGENKWVVVSKPPDNANVVREMDRLIEHLKQVPEYMEVTHVHENIARNLSQILTGRVSALSLLFPTEENDHQYGADVYYRKHPGRAYLIDMMSFVMDCRLEKVRQSIQAGKGVFRCLEVGAGTGALSTTLTKMFQEMCGDKFELWYTDISQAFFSKAEQKFEDYRGNMKFEVFNIEQSPLGQGIPLGYFDMVAATDVLHATRDLEETLVHLRQTLRPGGVLCFTETVIPARDITFVFGLLEGYWRFEDIYRRPHHCCVGEKVWGEVMSKSGFMDYTCYKVHVDQFAVLEAVADPNVRMDTLIPTRTQRNLGSNSSWVIFADGNNVELVSRVANTLVTSGYRIVLALREEQAKLQLSKEGVTTQVVKVEEEDASQIEELLAEKSVQGVIYCWGMDQRKVDQRQVALPFLQICKWLTAQTKPPKVYVVTQGVHAVTEDTVTNNPSAATIWGMAKSLKNECSNMLIRCVDLEQGSAVEDLAEKLFYEIATSKGFKEQNRVQVAHRGGLRYEPKLGKCQLSKQSEELSLPPSTDRYHLKLPQSRAIQDLEFEPLEVEPLGDTEIEVKTKAFSLNFKDILTILKPSKEFESLNAVGLDFSGVVVKAGQQTKWKVGQRVFGCNYKDEQLPSHLVVDYRTVVGIPDNMTCWEAATLPAVFSTAYHCLINVANMKKGDRVLIHTASGGVGLAAIQVAKMVGAEIITTAGNPRKRAYLRGLGIEHVFHSRDTSFQQDILRVTNGQGVNVVLNSITGPGIKEATLRSLAKDGRFVEMSKLSIWSPEEVKAMRPDVVYTIVDLTTVGEETTGKILERMNECLLDGQLKALPFVKFDALRIRQALQYFQKARHIGKVVVTMPEVSTQQGQFKTQVPLFNGQSTYLITGGLGGIGFEVCKWMLSLGATDIVLTGRRPPSKEIADQIKGLHQNGFNVQIKLGDIGNAEHCRTLIGEIIQEMKPLRGVMHCAGVLRDNLYAKQSWADFQATFNPKVQGTWNLHELTKNLLLEHFVVYSSATALIGTPAQPNHAAANCFEDAFIHYRHSIGLPGLSINWGQWAQVGVAKDVSFLSFRPVSVKRMLNGLESTLRTEKRQSSIVEFASLQSLATIVPLIKFYFEERDLKEHDNSFGQAAHNVNADKFWEEMDGASSKAEKMEVLSGYLKLILLTALRLDPDEKLSETADLQELGVDSLMMIELKNSIQSLMGKRLYVTANMLKNCTTIQLISGQLVSKILEEEEGEDEEEVPLEPMDNEELLQLLNKECQLPEEIQIAPNTKAAARADNVTNVLITGATGQVGAYMVAEICKSYPLVEKVVCLVRGAEDDSTALDKLKVQMKALDLQNTVNWDKIECVTGNVALNNLGIEQERYAELCNSIEAVIHLAAKTNYLEHLRGPLENGKGRDCRSVNIRGTVNILKFAGTGRVKHVFYPSVIISGILSGSEEAQLPDSWPEVGIIDMIVGNKFPGLQTSKWICEMLMEQANQRGIPCKVFRFPWIAGHSQTGRVNVLKNMYTLRFLSFMKLGAMPDTIMPAVGVPVDTCVQIALQLFLNENTPNEIFNVAHPQPEVEQEFVSLAKQEFGKTVEILEWEEFAKRLDQAILQPEESLKDVYRNLRQLSLFFNDAATFGSKYTQSPDTYFANKKVCRFLPDFGKSLESTMNTLGRDLNFVKEAGLFGELGI